MSNNPNNYTTHQESDNSWIETMSDMPAFTEPSTSDTNEMRNIPAPETTDTNTPTSETNLTNPNALEARFERNRDQFNSMTKRLVYITNTFPDIETAPASVQEEMTELILNRSRLSGENSGIQVMGVAEAQDGTIVSQWKLAEYNNSIAKRNELRQANQQQDYLSAQGEADIELPKIDLSSFQEKISHLGSDYTELESLNQELDKAQRFADLDSYAQLSTLKNEAVNRWTEQVKIAEQAELKRLETNLAEINTRLQQANESYQKLNIFQRAWKKFRHNDEREAIASEHSQARRALASFKAQKNL